MPQATLDDTVLARSEDVERVEGNLYFPRRDVDVSLLDESDTQYTCPWKGEAQYDHARVGDELVRDAAWSYPDPKPAAKNIAGYLAFGVRKEIEVA